MTVDLEDWYHSESPPERWDGYADRLQRPVGALLELFQAFHVRATFFVLGHVAEKNPGLVREIAGAGHEIAAHGDRHGFVYRQSEEAFARDVRTVKDRLEQIVAEPVVGYRAPFFSITNKSRWALSILRECGYRYDSSIFPVINHRYGIPGACRVPHRIELDGGSSIMEFPLSTQRVLGQNIPVSGGVYFRFFPYRIVRKAFRSLNREGTPGVFYIHAWEIDPRQPRLLLPPFLFLRRYHNLKGVREKLAQLLGDFEFRTLGELYRDYSGSRKKSVS